MTAISRLVSVMALALSAVPVVAQTCPCPPTLTPGWHGSAGAGAALTSGNTDTQSYNLALTLTYDPKKDHVVKIDGLYLKSRAEGADTAAKSAAGARGERKLGRAFLFAEGRYERDRFKALSYLLSPTAGLGYKIADTPRLAISVDAGAGFAIEKLTAQESTSSGAVRGGESITWQVSDTTRLMQSARALWKTSDLADAFYHLEGGIASSINQRLELKLGLLVDVKNRPARPGLEKTDTALLASLVFKL
jgi:putative salt-induced outer membrane protein YdiY